MALFTFLKGKEIKEAVTKTVQQVTNLFKFTDVGSITGGKGKYAKGATTDAYMEELYVYGCVGLISNIIASIPFKFYKDESKKEELKNHPASNLFSTKPNFKDSWYDFKEAISASLELDGNAFVVCDEKSPKQIFWLIPNRVNIVKNLDHKGPVEKIEDMIKGYEYGNKRGENKYLPAVIIHEKKFNIGDEFRGMSPISAAALTLDVSTEGKKQNFNKMVNGINTNAVFESDQPLVPEQHDRMRQLYKEKYAGTTNAYEPLWLYGGLKYRDAGMTLKDMDWVNLAKMSRDDICGFIYNVPLILLGVLENASYNNIKEAQKIFYEFCIKPRLVKNRELYQKIADRFGTQCWVDFDLSNIDALKEEQESRIKKAGLLWAMGTPLKLLNGMFNLEIPPFKGWEIGYLPYSVMPVGQEGKPKPSGEETNPDEGKHVNKKSIKWTPEMKDAHWKRVDSDARMIESKYINILNQFFDMQKMEVIANLNKYKSISYRQVKENIFVLIGELEPGKKDKISIETVLFDEEGEINKLKKSSIIIHREALKKRGNTELDLLGIEGAFDVSNPRVVAWLEKNALKKSKQVIGTARDKVKRELIAGVNEGESIPDIAKRIEDVYGMYIDKDGFEATTIARTEVIGASNQGSLEAYLQGGVEKKGWLATRDERTRDTHMEAENRYLDGIPVENDFKVGDGGGPCPGQIGLPEEDINCRCALIPITGNE